MPDFRIASEFAPTGDQPDAIGRVVDGIERGLRHQTLLGVTGSEDPERYNLEKLVGVTPGYALKVIAGKDHVEALFDPQFVDATADFLADPGVTPTPA